MSEEEKRHHIKYLWGKVRLAVVQKSTMKFIGTSALNTQKQNIFKGSNSKKESTINFGTYDPIADE